MGLTSAEDFPGVNDDVVTIGSNSEIEMQKGDDCFVRTFFRVIAVENAGSVFAGFGFFPFDFRCRDRESVFTIIDCWGGNIGVG